MKYLCLLIMPWLISSCSLLSPQRTPEVNQYNLDINVHTIAQARHTYRSILVSQPVPAPAFKSEKMAYTKRPLEIDYFANNQWAGPPAELLTPNIVAALQKTNHFRAVVSAPFTGNTTYILNSQLVQFTRHFNGNNAASSYVTIELRAQIINQHSRTIRASKNFLVEQPVHGATPYDGVTATNQALARLLSQLAQFCVKNT